MPRFVPRERKHKRLARQQPHPSANNENDTNAEIIISDPSTPKKALQRQPYAPKDAQLGKASAAKRKRLDKFIETKLKKEENTELLRKLAEQKPVDTALLRSSKRLGRGVEDSKRERLERALRARNKGLAGGEAILLERRKDVDLESEDGSEGDDRELEPTSEDGEVEMAVAAPSFGSGLKRPLDVDDSGRPAIRKRKRRRKDNLERIDRDEGALVAINGSIPPRKSENEEANEGEWTGFSSDASATSEHHHSSSSDREDETESLSSTSQTSADSRPARISAFKAWADSARNASLNFTPSSLPSNNDQAAKANFVPRQPSPDQTPSDMLTNGTSTASRPKHTLTIPRDAAIQSARVELPVVKEEQRIMETIYANPITIICGSTGSGKTTQVPQMLFEGGYGSQIGSAGGPNGDLPSKGIIGVTQPRRVAATSVATRVSFELGDEYGKKVAHQVRYDSSVKKETAIKFMTDGILLREIQQDFVMQKYSVVIVDETHERSVNTDILIGLLSRIVPLRAKLAKEQPDKFCELKLVIMSATLRIDDFVQNERLFRNAQPPVVEVEGRQFQVVEHFARRTRRDYVDEIVEKVARGHRQLPQGGMLVFLTGQEEIKTVERQLRARLGGGMNGRRHVDDYEDEVDDRRGDDEYLDPDTGGESDNSDSEAEIKVDDAENRDTEFDVPDGEASHARSKASLKPHILPLYAALPANQQAQVFQAPPVGHRLIILATNVAETSLTIPGIRYVFDSGRSKEKKYDSATGIQIFEIDWISTASAEQRKGRAGRTGPGGHVWRLYSSAVYERWFEEYSVPEILRTPLENVVLHLKGLEIENVANFPFPTAPDGSQLEKADKLLRYLGAVEGKNGRITELGKELTRFPVNPRFGKMLVLAKKNRVVDFIVATVAALGGGEVVLPPPHQQRRHCQEDRGTDSEDDDSRRQWEAAETMTDQLQLQAYNKAQATLSRWDHQSDAIKLLTAVAAYSEAEGRSEGDAKKFCTDYFLREKGMGEVQQLRRQLHNILTSQTSTDPTVMKPTLKLPLPSDKERTMLNQLVAAGYIDRVAIRTDLLIDAGFSTFGRKPRRATEVPYRTLIDSNTSSQLSPSATELDNDIARSVFIHPSSVLAKLSVNEMPQHIVYSHLSRATPSTIDNHKPKKTRMHPLTAIGPKVLAVLAESTPLLEFGKPIGKIEELHVNDRVCWVGVSLTDPGGSLGYAWPLGAWKVQQKRRKGVWEVEKVISR